MPESVMHPRLDCFDAETARMALSIFRDNVPKLLGMMRAEPEELPQRRQDILASQYQDIALYYYALGYPITAVIEGFRRAVDAYVQVFRLRGTAAPFEAYVVEPSPRDETGSESPAYSMRPLHNGERDFSSTNSRKAYYATCLALGVGDEQSASELTERIWDPPGASYIGPASFCTFDDQRLAYALRALYEGRQEDVGAELDRISQRAEEVRLQAELLRAIQREDATNFVRDLGAFLRWHEKEARLKKNRNNPEFFLSIPALGLTHLAIARRVCSLDDIEVNSPFLPRDLTAISLA